MNLKLKIWRQLNASTKGKMEIYSQKDVSPHMSFLEMLDVLNDTLEKDGKDPIAFDHDCREGICGACSLMINGKPHGGQHLTTACQLHMRNFNDGDTIVIEPWRAKAFPVVKDLIVDRNAFEDIQQAGGYVSVNTGSAPDANAIPIPKDHADWAMDNASCIGCGACVAVCKNASAMLFVSAKVNQFASLPQGQVEHNQRTIAMVESMDKAGFGHCTNHGECEAACPKGISMKNIRKLNWQFLKANL